MSFFDNLLSRLPSANQGDPLTPASTALAEPDPSRPIVDESDDVDEDLEYNLPPPPPPSSADTADAAEVTGADQPDNWADDLDVNDVEREVASTDVTNFAIFFNNSVQRDNEARNAAHPAADDRDLPDECFWSRGPLDAGTHQVDKICTTFSVDRSSLDRFLPMYNVAVNISTRMQYDRFTFLLLFIPVDADRRRLRLFAIRTFLDHEAELVRDILSFVGQRLFSRVFGLADVPSPPPSSFFHGTLSAELSRAFAHFTATADSTPSHQRLFLPSVFAYVVNVDAFLDQLCDQSTFPHAASSNTDHLPVFSLLKQSRDRLFALSRRAYNDPANVTDEVAVLKALSERLQSRKRKRTPEYDPHKRCKSSTRSGEADDAASAPAETRRAIAEHINDEPEYWSERLQPPRPNDVAARHDESSFCSFAKFADRVHDRSAFANLDERCNHDDTELSLPEAHVAFFQRYDSPSDGSSDAHLVEMVAAAFHAIDPLLFDRSRLARDVTGFDDVASCFLAGVQVEYFAARNKLNDVHRHVYLRHMELTRPRSFDYTAELNFSKNFTTYFDYYELVESVEPLLDNVPHIDASRILVPLEWLSNKLVRQALCTWSGHHLDFDVVPSLAETSRSSLASDRRQLFSPTYDFKRFVVCNYTRSRNYRRWARYVGRMQRQASLIFDIDPPFAAAAAADARKPLTVRDLLFGRSDSTTTPTTSSASSESNSTVGLFLGQLNQQSSTSSFLADVTSVLDNLMTKGGRSCGGSRPGRSSKSAAANWIFSLAGRFYGVKDTFHSSRAIGHQLVYDLTDSELYERSLIRLVVVKKLPLNSGSCVLWSPSSISASLSSAARSTTTVAERNGHILSLLSPADVASSEPETAAVDQPKQVPADMPEPSIVDFLRRFVGEYMSTTSGQLRSKFSACLEQVLFLDVLFRRSEPRFAVLVNGNPGTGKSTVMKYINRLVSRDSFTLLPTNVLREQVSSSLAESSEPLGDFPCISLVRRPVLQPEETGHSNHEESSEAGGEAERGSTAVADTGRRFVDGQPVVLTVSSFIKRALRYNLGPDVYSKIVERYLDQQLERLRLTLRPLSVTRDLFPLEKPVAAVLYPPIMQVDEYNLCTYAEHFVVARACQQLCVSRVYYGDFAQSSPIRGVNDNAELIALFAPLTVQFLDNKRLLNLNVVTASAAGTTADDDSRSSPLTSSSSVDLHTLLNDPVWNWKANNCDDGTNDYVRRLIARHVARPIYENRIARDHLLSSEVPIDMAELDRWYDSVARLNDWFDQKPCRRYVADSACLDELIRCHYPTFPLPCFISRRNLDSDRINYWLSRVVEDYVADRCARERIACVADRSRSFDKCFCLSVRRSAVASSEALKTSAHEIVQRSSAGDLDLGDSDESPAVPRNEFALLIDDDPWCADLLLIVGAVYRYIGPATKFMCSDSLLRLVAFLPEGQVDLDDQQERPASARPKKHERSGYRCNDQDCPLDCVRSVAALKRKLRTLEKLADHAPSPSFTALPMTLGCGLPFLAHSDAVRSSGYQPAYPRLLMQRLRTRDEVAPTSSTDKDSETVPDTCDGNSASSFVVLSRSKFSLNRCNSKWTTNIYTNQPKREGICLFGYPLVLNCGVSSWRVQGETIPTSSVFVDLKYMNKQQALVSLSRVRRSDQISRVLNVNLYAR